ncbi:MAG TPA: carboxypeptidase-like regulatory domain-containing protein [Polyangiaceae bacterium]|nr:carboxypeptidase-like regulatory domain-containing protein [Polyangiaceae bacterium]
MKTTILGAVLVPLVLFAACGGDGGSSDAPSKPGANDGGVDSGGADSGNETSAGEAGQSTVPTTQGGDASEGGTISGQGGRSDALGGAPGEMTGNGGAPQLPNSPVSGHIFSMSGVALEGAVVTINGESTLTDENGAFTLDDVPPKYDVTVIYSSDAGGLQAAELVDDLTTRDLSLRLWQVRNDASSASVFGKLAAAVAKGHEAVVQLVGEHTTSPSDSLPAGSTDYDMELQWEGGGDGVADLVGLEWAIGETGPSSYTGFARKSMQAPDGTGVIANLTLVKPTQKTVAGTLTAEGAPPLDSFLNFGPIQIQLTLQAGSIAVVVPEIGVTPIISVAAPVGDAYATVKAPATLKPLALEIPAAPKLILPIDKAKVDLNTEFIFTRPGKLAAVWWALGSWMVVHVTDQTKLKLPDLRTAGIVYDIGDDLAPWVVDTYGPAETPEEFLRLMDGTSPMLETSLTTTARATRSLYLPN